MRYCGNFGLGMIEHYTVTGLRRTTGVEQSTPRLLLRRLAAPRRSTSRIADHWRGAGNGPATSGPLRTVAAKNGNVRSGHHLDLHALLLIGLVLGRVQACGKAGSALGSNPIPSTRFRCPGARPLSLETHRLLSADNIHPLGPDRATKHADVPIRQPNALPDLGE